MMQHVPSCWIEPPLACTRSFASPSLVRMLACMHERNETIVRLPHPPNFQLFGGGVGTSQLEYRIRFVRRAGLGQGCSACRAAGVLARFGLGFPSLCLASRRLPSLGLGAVVVPAVPVGSCAIFVPAVAPGLCDFFTCSCPGVAPVFCDVCARDCRGLVRLRAQRCPACPN